MWSILPKQYLAAYESKYKLDSQYPDKEYILNEVDDNVFLPRLFFYNYPDPHIILHKDNNFKPELIEIKSIINPRENQLPALDHITNVYKTKGYISGVINAYPGWGKTAVSTFITAITKKKTLIIVDNKKLKDQFIEAYTTFTDLTIDDIGIIQGKSFSLDKPVTITMVQTLLSKLKKDIKGTYTKIRSAGFDLVIYDEVHKTSSGPKYALSTLLLNTYNVIGLSATPYLRGIHKLLLDNSIGLTLYKSKEYELIPRIFFIKYNSAPNPKLQYMMRILRDYVKRQACYNKHITKNENYLYVIYKLAKKCQDSGYKTIIMVSTMAQVDGIIEYLKRNGIEAKPVCGKEHEINKEVDNVLVATYKFASHGFDFAELSAIILASPYKGSISLVQMIGRILRLSLGKKQPVVFDLMDAQVPALFETAMMSKTKIFQSEFGQDVEINVLNFN
jgi:superfamily II DNA or RNA helicase